MKITQIIGREILDSRGNPTVEAKVILENGMIGVAAVPSGASTGVHEAVELRDDDKKRFLGRGVLKAVANVNKNIAKKMCGHSVFDQRKLDKMMLEIDSTANKSVLGANAILSVSLAAARAGALASNRPLYQYLREVFELPEKEWRFPLPTMNIINGGKHADNSLTVQEFMVVPAVKGMAERIRAGAEVFHCLKKILKQAGHQTLVGDEGGFAPSLKRNEEAFEYICEATKASGYKIGKDAYCAADVALSEYYDAKTGGYSLNDKTKKKFISADAVMKTMADWCERFPILSLEDPLAEDDWSNWQKITKALGKKVALVGDDLFVTNVERLQRGIETGVANAILIKLNQIGSLSETIDAIYLAKKNNYQVSVSNRSGETADTFIADLAVAVNADFIKTGSLSRSERVEKYNRLMEIEAQIRIDQAK